MKEKLRALDDRVLASVGEGFSKLSSNARGKRQILADAIKHDSSEALKASKGRALGKTALAAFNVVWLNAEDAVWFAGTDTMLQASRGDTISTAIVLGGAATAVAAANTALSFKNIHHLKGDKKNVSSEEIAQDRSTGSVIRKHIGKFGVTMAVGAPINVMQEDFTKPEVIAHNIGYALTGTAIIGAAYEGISRFSYLDTLDNPLVVSALAGSVVATRYVRNVFRNANALQETAGTVLPDELLPFPGVSTLSQSTEV